MQDGGDRQPLPHAHAGDGVLQRRGVRHRRRCRLAAARSTRPERRARLVGHRLARAHFRASRAAAVAAPRGCRALPAGAHLASASLKALGLADGGGPEGGRSIDETIALEFLTTTSSRRCYDELSIHTCSSRVVAVVVGGVVVAARRSPSVRASAAMSQFFGSSSALSGRSSRHQSTQLSCCRQRRPLGRVYGGFWRSPPRGVHRAAAGNAVRRLDGGQRRAARHRLTATLHVRAPSHRRLSAVARPPELAGAGARAPRAAEASAGLAWESRRRRAAARRFRRPRAPPRVRPADRQARPAPRRRRAAGGHPGARSARCHGRGGRSPRRRRCPAATRAER